MGERDTEFGEDIESPPHQTEDHVEEAVPQSEIASTIADLPNDFGDAGLADFPDPAWDEVEDDDFETPDEGEPKAEDEDAGVNPESVPHE